MAKLNIEGCALYEELCKNLSVPYKRCGSVVLAFSDEEKELYTLFAEIVETMNKIRQYEQQHGAKKSNIPNTIVWLFNGTYDTRTGELISGKEYEFTPEYFFRLIAFGKLFLRNPEEDDD